MSDTTSGSVGDVDEAIEALETVTSRARSERSPVGYFSALYAQVTRTVARGIETDFFDDGPRMQRLVTSFASRYLAALDDHRHGRGPTRCWGVAFDAADDAMPIALQHLLLGINAHINLDLGVAAAGVAPGDEISGLRRDFDRINEVLALMTGRAQQALAQISPWLGFLDVVGGRADDEVIRFSIAVARREAWRFAVALAGTPVDDQLRSVAARDDAVARLGRRVRRPGVLTSGLWVIRLRESRDVPGNIDLLTSMGGPDLSAVEQRVPDDPTPP